MKVKINARNGSDLKSVVDLKEKKKRVSHGGFNSPSWRSNLGIVMLLLMFSLTLVSASYLPHKQNTELNFSITSNFATSCELTTINSPTGIILIEQTDTSTGTFNFNIGSENFSSLGTYCMNIVCTDGDKTTSGQECREVTARGISRDTGWVMEMVLWLLVYPFIYFILIHKTKVPLYNFIGIFMLLINSIIGITLLDTPIGFITLGITIILAVAKLYSFLLLDTKQF